MGWFSLLSHMGSYSPLYHQSCHTHLLVILIRVFLFFLLNGEKRPNPFLIKQCENLFFWYLETTFCYTFPFSDLQFLPPKDCRVLCANTGIWILVIHLLNMAKHGHLVSALWVLKPRKKLNWRKTKSTLTCSSRRVILELQFSGWWKIWQFI